MSSGRQPYQAAALERQIEQRLADRKAAIAEKYEQDTDYGARYDSWLVACQTAVEDLYSKVLKGTVVATELSGFTLPSMPSQPGPYTKTPEETRDQALERAGREHTRSINRLAALKVEEGGLVFLTTSMLDDLFGL